MLLFLFFDLFFFGNSGLVFFNRLFFLGGLIFLGRSLLNIIDLLRGNRLSEDRLGFRSHVLLVKHWKW